jgi:two-component system sensor histidine kinase YesM
MNLTVPKLILQPIVENSIIHGMEAEEDNLNIVIDGFVKEEKLIIEISDDGPGIEDEIMKVILKDSSDRNKFSKVGLNNVNQRIKLYCGGEFGLKIETEYGKGTKVIVVLPVISLHMLTRNRY